MSYFSLPALGWSHVFQQQLTLEDLEQGPDNQLIARISGVARDRLQALSEQGELNVLLPGHWRQQFMAHELPTVGDWVLLERKADQWLVRRLLERKSLLRRKAAGDKIQQQLLAANVDLLLVVTSCNHDFNLSRLERYQVFAEESGCEVVVVATKADLADDQAHYEQQLAAVPGIDGYCVLDARGEDVRERLSEFLRPGMTVSLVGSSGVGKSTLTNSLLGQTTQDTGGIREQDSKGRHTTTSRALLPLAQGLCVIDTPGMRELQLSGASAGSEVFDDVVALLDQCRFNDCSHQGEPGCAIQAALDSGELTPRRWESYLKLSQEAARSSVQMQSAEQRHRAQGKRFKQIAKNMHARRQFERKMGLKG